MRLALAQYALTGEMTVNVDKAFDFMRMAKDGAAQLVLFPELCLSPFFPRCRAQLVDRYAITLEHDYVRQFREACRRLRLAASPNVYLNEGGRRFDASLMISAEGILLGVSKMVHIAQVPGFYEQDYYTPSDTGFVVYETAVGRIGIVVCFDRHYPESIRTCVLRGASIVLIPTANTTEESRELFICELRAAALQNGVYIAMCNRVGKEGDVTFCGESIVVNPHGEVTKLGGESEELILADIDLGEIAVARSRRPYLALRRPEMYE
jgi:predicted amidohydrolase